MMGFIGYLKQKLGCSDKQIDPVVGGDVDLIAEDVYECDKCGKTFAGKNGHKKLGGHVSQAHGGDDDE